MTITAAITAPVNSQTSRGTFIVGVFMARFYLSCIVSFG
jgi:hypothetical protein